MKKILSILIAAAFLSAGCSDNNGVPDVFYSEQYPIDSIGATVSIAPDPDIPDSLQVESPLLQQIQADVLANAPVRAGGSYRLDFNRYNSGPLTVEPEAQADTLAGTFLREPAADSIRFTYGASDYLCRISDYAASTGSRNVLFTVDLTAQYQEQYPDGRVESVTREEYTDTPY